MVRIIGDDHSGHAGHEEEPTASLHSLSTLICMVSPDYPITLPGVPRLPEPILNPQARNEPEMPLVVRHHREIEQ